MKKSIFLVIAVFLLFSLIGCENPAVSKAIEQGKMELLNKEYDNALSSLNFAIEEGTENQEVKELVKIIKDFNVGKKLIKEGNFEEAKKVLDSINKNYSNYAIKEDIEKLKSEILAYEENNKFVNNKITTIENLINEGKYIDAKTESEQLLSSERVISETQKQKISIKVKRINDELEAKKKAEALITFKDKALEKVVRKAINKPEGDILKSDVQNVNELSAEYPMEVLIKNIDGIEHMGNLEKIDFWRNDISDINPLKNLIKLKSLELGDNKISDISVLSNLTNLENLGLDRNNIKDINPLRNLTKLKELRLSFNNDLNDISPLDKLILLEDPFAEMNSLME